MLLCTLIIVETGHYKDWTCWTNRRWNQTFCTTWRWSW